MNSATNRPALRFGIDQGGTKIEGAILDARGEVVFRERIATEAEGGYEHVLGRVAGLYMRMATAAGGAAHTLGIGAPGSISPTTGLARNSNTVSLNGRPYVQDLARAIGRDRFVVANDANCFALAEALLGAARGAKVVFGVIMGTGCGGGLVWDGAVHVGRSGIGGEWGHHVIDPSGAPCYCGARGCAETFISGAGLERAHAERSGTRIPATAIIDAWRGGDEAARATMDRFFAAFGRAIANLIDILDPDAIVIGGGLSNLDELYTRGRDEVASRVFSDRFDTPILKNALGDSAGVIGAALAGVA